MNNKPLWQMGEFLLFADAYNYFSYTDKATPFNQALDLSDIKHITQ